MNHRQKSLLAFSSIQWRISQKGEAGEIGYCLILVFKNRAPLLGEDFANRDKQINCFISSAIEKANFIYFCHDFAFVGLALMDFDRPGDDVIDKHVDVGPY